MKIHNRDELVEVVKGRCYLSQYVPGWLGPVAGMRWISQRATSTTLRGG